MNTPTAETIWIDIPRGRLAALDEGAGPPVVLVHSAVVNRRSWDGVVPHLVAAGYRVLRDDMRGFGESASEDVEFVAHELPEALASLIVAHLAPLPRWG